MQFDTLGLIILTSPAIIVSSLVISIPRILRNASRSVQLELKDGKFKVEKDPLINKYKVSIDFIASSPKDSVFIMDAFIIIGNKRLCLGYVGEYLEVGETRHIHLTSLFDVPPPIGGDVIEVGVVAFNATPLEDGTALRRSFFVALHFVARREPALLLPVDMTDEAEKWQGATSCESYIFHNP